MHKSHRRFYTTAAAAMLMAATSLAQAIPLYDSQPAPETATKDKPYTYVFDLTDNGFTNGDILTGGAIDLWVSGSKKSGNATFNFKLGDANGGQLLSFQTKNGSPQTYTLTTASLDDLMADGKISLSYTPTKANGTLTINSRLTADLQEPAPVPAASVPEPASMAMLGIGLLGLGLMRKRAK